MILKHLTISISFGAVCFFNCVALAQDSADAQAKAAFSEGTDLFRDEQYKAAANAFHEAYRLKPSWKILFNMGQCHAAAKEYGLALESFQAYLSEGGDEIPTDKKTEAINEVRTLRDLVGYLAFHGEDGITIYADENERGETPLPGPIPVSAGVNHSLRFEKAGAIVSERTVRVNSGNTLEVDIAASHDTSSDSTEDETSPKTEDKGTPKKNNTKRLSVIGFTLGGVGVATLAGALGTGVAALSINSSFSEKACSGNACDNDVRRMDNLVLATNLLLGVGGALTVTGAALIIVSAVKKKKAKKTVSIFPEVSSDTVGVTIGYRF